MDTILIVEDNDESRYMLDRLLTARGYATILAENGAEALEAARRTAPDLIVTDIMMPVMNGFRLCREIKTDEALKQIPVVFYTATFVEAEDEKLAISLGASRFIIKPQDGEHLVAAVRNVLEESRQGTGPQVPETGLKDTFLDLYDHSLTRKLTETVEHLEKKRSELEASEKRLKEAQEIAHIGHWEYDLAGKSLVWSDEVYRIFGYAPQTFAPSYKKFLVLVHPDDRPDVKRAYRATLEKRLPFDLEHRLILKDGTRKWVVQHCQTLYDDSGQPVSQMGTVQDVTAYKALETALKSSEEQYRRFFENSVVGIYSSTPDGRFITVNQAFAAMLGYSGPEDLISAVTDIAAQYYVDPTDRNHFQGVIKTVGHLEDVEFRVRRKDGGIIWVSNSSRAYFDDQGQVTHYEGIVIDITERKTLEKKLVQAQKMEAFGVFAGGIAHDFNNILSAIIGYSELALSGMKSGAALEDDLREIHGAGLRARDLVKQILTFARQSDDALKPVRVDMIAKEVLKFIRPVVPSTIEIRQDIRCDDRIIGNPSQVHQLFMNLCTNACQAMEKSGGVLTVSLLPIPAEKALELPGVDLEARSYLEIRVADTGEGIPSDIMDTVFEPYFTTKAPGEGTGMGLAVVHGIVQSCGGRIAVESTPGQGAAFSVYLPILASVEEPMTEREVDLPGGNERILFVDDEPSIARMARRILEELGYTVVLESNGRRALDWLLSTPDGVDLVVSDMTMPGLTGDRLASELHAIRPDIPVILCTGFSRKLSGISPQAIGVAAVVMKPFDQAELALAIRNTLDSAGAL